MEGLHLCGVRSFFVNVEAFLNFISSCIQRVFHQRKYIIRKWCRFEIEG
jgi:hypothetical protein